MAIYRYKGVNMAGDTMTGQYEAADKETVIAMLRNNGYYPVSIELQKDKNQGLWFSELRRLPIKDIAVFCRQFATVIQAGIPIVQALRIMQQQVSNKNLKHSLDTVYEEVLKGRTLSESMRQYPTIFPAMLVEMVSVGEASGTLDMSLQRMADTYEKQYKLQQKIGNALVYPAVVSCVALAVLAFMLLYVVPTFVSVFTATGMQLPLPTRVLLGLSNFIHQYAALLLLALIGIAVVFVYYISTENGRRWFDRLKLTMPALGALNLRVAVSNFAHILSTLLASGIDLSQALHILRNVMKNKVIQGYIDQFIADIEAGRSLADAIEQADMLPVMLSQMTRIGEESGSLDAMLAQTAGFYDMEVENMSARLTSMIEPIIIVVLGMAVGFIVVSIALPMFTMISTVPGV